MDGGHARVTVAARLAEFVCQTPTDAIPVVALERAQMVVASTLASAAVGFSIDSAAVVRGLAEERGGVPEAAIWFGVGARLPVAMAARANAVASDAAASDDSDLRNIAHIGTVATATALGVGQRVGATGREVLAAMVLGYDVAARIGQSITPGFSERGFHGSVITIFGGAVAAGRLLRLTLPQQAQALAIAATSIGGLYAAANTSEAREYHAGLSAMLGVEAALTASRGFRAEEAILETRRGFFDTFGAHDVDQVIRGLGESWEITTHMAIKLMPGAHPYHAAAEASARAAAEANVAPDEIARITVAARSMGRELVYHPTDLVGMAHSLPYFVAAAAVDRTFTWVHATPDKVLDPLIGRVQDLVRLDPVAQRHVEIGRTCGGAVTIETRSGQQVTRTVQAPRGSGLGGIAWADVDAKYRALLGAARIPDGRIESSLASIHALASADDVDAVADRLVDLSAAQRRSTA